LLLVAPNARLALEAFNFSSHHAAYKASMGRSSRTGKGVSIAVVDTGLESSATWTASRKDLWNPTTGNADDSVGHGTATATVVHDVAPDASVHVIKFADSAQLSEWDALAGVHAAASYDVINLSWSFGLQNAVCSTCGRKSTSSRSVIFENILNNAVSQPQQPIVVAAAGNQSAGTLRYPARFANVMAIGAVDAHGQPAPYTNFGVSTVTSGLTHTNLFFAPGGRRGTTGRLDRRALRGRTSIRNLACGRIRRGCRRLRMRAPPRSAFERHPEPER
jgi:hypothetical protein